MQLCIVCDSPTKSQNRYCSKVCEENMADIVSMTIPKGWVTKTLKRASSNKNEAVMLDAFATRHNYKIKLLKRRLFLYFNYTVGEIDKK